MTHDLNDYFMGSSVSDCFVKNCFSYYYIGFFNVPVEAQLRRWSILRWVIANIRILSWAIAHLKMG